MLSLAFVHSLHTKCSVALVAVVVVIDLKQESQLIDSSIQVAAVHFMNKVITLLHCLGV